MEKTQVVRTFAFPANEQTSEAVVPCVRSLYDPSPRLAPSASDEGWLSAAADVRLDTAFTHGPFAVRVVIALVEADVVGTSRATRGTGCHRVERRAQQPLVMNVRAGDHGRKGHSSAVGQYVPLDAALRPVGWVGPGLVPPFGAFTMALSSEAHSQSIPRMSS